MNFSPNPPADASPNQSSCSLFSWPVYNHCIHICFTVLQLRLKMAPTFVLLSFRALKMAPSIGGGKRATATGPWGNHLPAPVLCPLQKTFTSRLSVGWVPLIHTLVSIPLSLLLWYSFVNVIFYYMGTGAGIFLSRYNSQFNSPLIVPLITSPKVTRMHYYEASNCSISTLLLETLPCWQFWKWKMF